MNLAVTVMQITYAGQPIPPEYLYHGLLGADFASSVAALLQQFT